MKIVKYAAMATAIVMAGSAFAQSTPTSAANGTGTASAGAQGGAVVFAPVSGDVNNRYSASSAIAPQLVAGMDTCMGSSSVGGSATTFSFSVGTTWKDEDCRRVKDARELWNMGRHAAAMALLCTDEDTRYAIAVSGGVPMTRDDGTVVPVNCPMSKDEWVKAGRPLLDPVTGQPMTTAQLNPPTRQVPVASAADLLKKLSPEQRDQLVQAVKAEQVEQHAAEIQGQLTKTTLTSAQ